MLAAKTQQPPNRPKKNLQTLAVYLAAHIEGCHHSKGTIQNATALTGKYRLAPLADHGSENNQEAA